MPKDAFGRTRHFTIDEEAAAVVGYLRDGKSLSELASEFDADRQGVRQVLRRHGVQMRTYREWLDLRRQRAQEAVRKAMG